MEFVPPLNTLLTNLVSGQTNQNKQPMWPRVGWCNYDRDKPRDAIRVKGSLCKVGFLNRILLGAKVLMF